MTRWRARPSAACAATCSSSTRESSAACATAPTSPTRTVARIANTDDAWRGEKDAGECPDIAAFCKSVTLEEVHKHDHVLTPGHYVEPFEEKMQRLTATLREQQAEAAKLDGAIVVNLKVLEVWRMISISTWCAALRRRDAFNGISMRWSDFWSGGFPEPRSCALS
jgi:hypothetical protein